MNRLKVTLPDHFSYSTPLTIRLSDLNYGGHVGNDAILSILQEARQQFLRSRGQEELNIDGYGLIMVDALIEYKKELNYADSIIVSVIAIDFDKMGFDFYYKIELIQEGKWILATRAKTGMLFYDYANKKKVPVSEELIQLLS
jgi:acyl-CoA thioester hydrolase